jgi:hypothetical protein
MCMFETLTLMTCYYSEWPKKRHICLYSCSYRCYYVHLSSQSYLFIDKKEVWIQIVSSFLFVSPLNSIEKHEQFFSLFNSIFDRIGHQLMLLRILFNNDNSLDDNWGSFTHTQTQTDTYKTLYTFQMHHHLVMRTVGRTSNVSAFIWTNINHTQNGHSILFLWSSSSHHQIIMNNAAGTQHFRAINTLHLDHGVCVCARVIFSKNYAYDMRITLVGYSFVSVTLHSPCFKSY